MLDAMHTTAGRSRIVGERDNALRAQRIRAVGVAAGSKEFERLPPPQNHHRGSRTGRNAAIAASCRFGSCGIAPVVVGMARMIATCLHRLLHLLARPSISVGSVAPGKNEPADRNAAASRSWSDPSSFRGAGLRSARQDIGSSTHTVGSQVRR